MGCLFHGSLVQQSFFQCTLKYLFLCSITDLRLMGWISSCIFLVHWYICSSWTGWRFISIKLFLLNFTVTLFFDFFSWFQWELYISMHNSGLKRNFIQNFSLDQHCHRWLFLVWEKYTGQSAGPYIRVYLYWYRSHVSRCGIVCPGCRTDRWKR